MKSLTILSFLWKCYNLWWLLPGVCELRSLLAIFTSVNITVLELTNPDVNLKRRYQIVTKWQQSCHLELKLDKRYQEDMIIQIGKIIQFLYENVCLFPIFFPKGEQPDWFKNFPIESTLWIWIIKCDTQSASLLWKQLYLDILFTDFNESITMFPDKINQNLCIWLSCFLGTDHKYHFLKAIFTRP